MTRRGRTALFLAAAVGVGTLLVLAFLAMPTFGTQAHPYGSRAVSTAIGARHTANTVASVNFDQRALDTLGEEFILFASVIGVLVLLRPSKEEREQAPEVAGQRGTEHVLDATRLLGYVLLPVTVLIGWYIVVHGHVSPGGGFQGGVILGSGLHLLYLAGDYRTLLRARPAEPFDVAESLGAGAFVLIGLAAMVSGAAFLANVLPTGTMGMLASAGTVPLLNTAVGVEVAAGVVLLLSRFFEQDLAIRDEREAEPT